MNNEKTKFAVMVGPRPSVLLTPPLILLLLLLLLLVAVVVVVVAVSAFLKCSSQLASNLS